MIRSLPPRLRPLAWLCCVYLAINLATRLTLLCMAGTGVPHAPGMLARVFGIGLGYDLVTFLYVAWPLLLLAWLVPTRVGGTPGWKRWLYWLAGLTLACGACLLALRLAFNANWKTAWPVLIPFLYVLPMAAFTWTSRTGQWALYALAFLCTFGLLFTAAAELVFWDEFGSRFNFIAVDYLVYTREVIGNIRESYPVGRWLGMLAVLALAIVAASRRWLDTRGDTSRLGQRSPLVAAWLILTVASAFALSAGDKDRSGNAYADALAGNGIYEFFAAFRHADLDFHRFYRELPDAEAYRLVRGMLHTPEATFTSSDPHDLTREIRHAGPERHLNVVLVSVESLSADYLAAFGETRGLTPNLDALADQGLFFDQLYANGTRTVRGLEALALSVPPTPGDSLLKQRGATGLFSLASIFNQRGYVSEFVYGGYGYFDNMNAFFAANGYDVADRRDMPKDIPIHAENVWGVADEDLFSLAMHEMDRIHAQGKPFFLHVMTTSNHRPYTFPEGRVDLPQGQRASAVKYTDWAIGDFLARMRAKPYFADTLFVITADHCASSAGSTRIPLNRYHIPLWIYAPAHVQPRRVETLMAQIDIPPTVLGLLDFSYRSRFFGRDIFRVADGDERAFPSTYANLGTLETDGYLTILSPGHKLEQVRPDPLTGAAVPHAGIDAARAARAIAAYQVAYDEFHSDRMRWRAADSTPVSPAPPAASAAPPQGFPPRSE